MFLGMRRLIALALLCTTACPSPGEEDIDTVTQFSCNCDIDPQPCCCNTPIVIDTAGDGIKLTTWEDGVIFNLIPWRGPAMRAWTELGSDDAWLIFDATGNGIVDNGTEMFGDMTYQPPGESKNGFRALAVHDTNSDGTIDQNDPIFTQLELWTDRNHDGVSQSDELDTLVDKGIAALSVEYAEHRKADGKGNVFRYSAAVTPAPGSEVGMTAWDVILTSPMRAEREAHGLPDPVPVAFDDAEPEGEPKLRWPRSKSTQVSSAKPPIICFASHTILPPTITSGNEAQTQGKWSIEAPPCPSFAFPNIGIWESFQGQWYNRGASGPQMKTSNQWAYSIKIFCAWYRQQAWKGWIQTTFPSPWVVTPPGAFGSRFSQSFPMICSTTPPPPDPC
jgi:hypothetical protein